MIDFTKLQPAPWDTGDNTTTGVDQSAPWDDPNKAFFGTQVGDPFQYTTLGQGEYGQYGKYGGLQPGGQWDPNFQQQFAPRMDTGIQQGGGFGGGRSFDPSTIDPTTGMDASITPFGDLTATGGTDSTGGADAWTRPDWFTEATQPWPEWQSQYGGTPSETWYRDPSWGSHAIYNQDYGFQDYPTIGGLYQEHGWGSDLAEAGLTPQMGSDWASYGFEPKGDDFRGEEGGGVSNWQDWFKQLREQWGQAGQGMGQQGAPVYGQAGMSPWGQAQNTFQYPQEWNTASNVLSQFAQGLPTQTPWQWQQGSDIASQMAQTGMPTDYSPLYKQAKQAASYDVRDAINQAAEQAGLTGTRWSSGLGRTAQDIAGRYGAQLGLGYTGQQMGALEAARGRQMGGLGALQQFGAGTAGLTEAAKGRGMQAAGMLPGLGQMYQQAPQDWAQRIYGMGAGMQQQGQSALDRYRQEYMRMAPEYNPWVNQAMSYWGTPSQMGYQQYQPSFMSQLMGGLGGVGMGIGGLCGG